MGYLSACESWPKWVWNRWCLKWFSQIIPLTAEDEQHDLKIMAAVVYRRATLNSELSLLKVCNNSFVSKLKLSSLESLIPLDFVGVTHAADELQLCMNVIEDLS